MHPHGGIFTEHTEGAEGISHSVVKCGFSIGSLPLSPSMQCDHRPAELVYMSMGIQFTAITFFFFLFKDFWVLKFEFFLLLGATKHKVAFAILAC